MRFKVKFSDAGFRVLDKRKQDSPLEHFHCFTASDHIFGVHAVFLPTLEKFGKTCQLLLAPNEIFLIQTTANTDGPHVVARFDVVSIQHPSYE
jgi:hypothetical protein